MIEITTQKDKKTVKVKEAIVDGNKVEGMPFSLAVDYQSKTLGKYESNERALEVHDDIFAKIGGAIICSQNTLCLKSSYRPISQIG